MNIQEELSSVMSCHGQPSDFDSIDLSDDEEKIDKDRYFKRKPRKNEMILNL